MTYRPTIGLEVHAELSTRTKMFCSCKNAPEASEPNTHVCPVCMAHPGTLPVPNEEAVRKVLQVGAAIGGTLADFSEFDRKSYFYPDIPKGYQISQYEHPLVKGGSLAGVAITRIHLEEDTARSSHASGASLVDFNRAGVPLMELVTEPVIHDAETAGRFARELQLLLRTLGASHANLEKGEMRVEANVSVSKGDTMAKAYVEIKNLNSFRSVERAIAFEIDRQSKLLEEGGEVVKETRGWDENSQRTFSQRVKEGSADYRYFPEPDIPKLGISSAAGMSETDIRASLPELPWDRRARYEAAGVKTEDAAFLTASTERARFFDRVLVLADGDAELVRLSTNYIVSDLAGYYAKSGTPEFEHVEPETFVTLMQMLKKGALSSRGAKDVLLVMALSGGSPEVIAGERGLLQVSDTEALRKAVQQVIAEQEAAASEYRAGKVSIIQFLVGQGMKATRGAGNPAVLKELFEEELGRGG